MKNTEKLVRSVLGPTRIKVRPLVLAIETMEYLLFEEGMYRDDIMVTKDIYPVVAKRLDKSEAAVSRSIARTVSQCWCCGDAAQMAKIVGRELKDIYLVSDLLFYFAYYRHHMKPYYESARCRKKQ